RHSLVASQSSTKGAHSPARQYCDAGQSPSPTQAMTTQLPALQVAPVSQSASVAQLCVPLQTDAAAASQLGTHVPSRHAEPEVQSAPVAQGASTQVVVLRSQTAFDPHSAFV